VSRWLLDFTTASGCSGFVRLELRAADAIAWYWTYLMNVPNVDGVIVVRDHEVLLPRQGLEIRADGLWAELWCESPREHWTFGLESFGVRLDDPRAALRPGGEIGDRIAVGLDIDEVEATVYIPLTDRGDHIVRRLVRPAGSVPVWSLEFVAGVGESDVGEGKRR
jgi:hypothetical protein